MIRISESITVDEREIGETFIRSSGPGGQNVNKVSSAVQIRFDVRHSPSLPTDVRERAEKLAGRRLTSDGVLVITAQRFRTQERNRTDAIDRLVELLRRAVEPPTPRRPTRPTRASRAARLERKRHRASVKSLRRPPGSE